MKMNKVNQNNNKGIYPVQSQELRPNYKSHAQLPLPPRDSFNA